MLSSLEAKAFIMAMLPVFELRLALPWALGMHINPWMALFITIVGNMVPVLPLFLILRLLTDNSFIGRKLAPVMNWIFTRTRRKSDLVNRYGAIGLCLFVAVPLPGTGAWSGVAAAFLIGMRLRYAFPAIFGGVVIAGLIVLTISMGGLQAIRHFL